MIMEESEVLPIYPLKVSSQHNFGVSPFGVYCFECSLPVGNSDGEITVDALRMHIQRKKCFISKELQIVNLVKALNKSIQHHYCNVRNFGPWISKAKSQRFKCSCGILFKRQFNLDRHISNAKNSNPKSIHLPNSTESVMTTCGREIDISILDKMMNVPIQTVPNYTRPATSAIQINDKQTKFIPINRENRKWITTTLNHIKCLFTPYKRPDEMLDPYLPSLKLFTIYESGSVTDRIQDCLSTIDDECRSSDSTLDFFLGCSEKWVKVYCREHVNMLDGKTRFQLQSFFDETILVNSGYNLNFNMRDSEETIIKEMALMIKLSWKLHEKGSCNDILSSEITNIKNEIQKLEIHHNGTVTDSAVEDMVQGLCIQQYLHSILIEPKNNAYCFLMGHHMITLRLFKLKKNSNGDSSDSFLSMRTCGQFGSIISLHIHIYRLASASMMACTESKCWNVILEEVKDSSLFHMLSPLINKVKQMNNTKIEVRKKQLKENGDIIIDDFYFSKSQWCKLVPNLKKLFDEILEFIFTENKWKTIVDRKNEVQVQKIEGKEEECTKEELLHYNFYTNINGKLVSEKDFYFKKDIHFDTIERLTAITMICLHGTGLGATRISELLRIQQHQMYWKGGCFYYITISNKRGNSNSSTKKTVTHKLPSCISRYLLLYDYIGREFAEGRDTFLFSKGNDIIEGSYENKFIYSEFASLFELQSNCGCLVMRHLYTSICNYVFPGNNNNFDSSIVSTVDQIAEMSGHSVETHEKCYSSAISKESFFDTYHQSIGAQVIYDDENITPLGMATESDVLHCLKVLMGVRGEFLSQLQKNMVMDACNNFTRHTFCSIGCGGGKSLSWIIPTLRHSLNRTRSKLSIVVVPYCFLLDHHVISTKRLVGQCSNISVESLKGKDVDDNIIPNTLRDKDSLPSILFVSLEAIKTLVEYHYLYFEQLEKDDLMYKIYIDECHTILSELNFRRNYHSLAKLAQLNIPIALFSGSFQKGFILDFLKYMFGSRDGQMYKFYIDQNIFGDRLMKMEHIILDNYTTECCNRVIKFVASNNKSNVHIIVSTKNEGSVIYDMLKRKNIRCDYINSDSVDQHAVAKRWNSNLTQVLITTTLGIVGNESSRTQMVCIVGLLYNLPSILQSYGRIRPRRRNQSSLCSIYTAKNNVARLKGIEVDSSRNFDELVGSGIVSSSNKSKYNNSMTTKAVHDWLFKDQGCRLVNLAGRLGFRHPKCNICDMCTDTCVRVSSDLNKKKMINNNEQRKIGERILQRMKQKCLICNSAQCNGSCVVKKMQGVTCYHCLGNHVASRCKREYRNILKGKACYSCYVYNHSEDCIHNYTECSGSGGIKERFRGLIQYDYLAKRKKNEIQTSFLVHLSGIFATVDSFFMFLYKYRDWK